MATFAKLREIVEEADVSAEIDTAETKFARFEDAWNGLKWLLARRGETLGEAPRGGSANTRLYVQAGDPLADAPEIWILFKIEGEQILVSAIRFLKAANDTES